MLEKTIVETYIVPEIEIRDRLSDYLPGKFETILSRKGIKNAIKKGLVRVDSKVGKTGDFIKGGEKIELLKGIQKERPIIPLKVQVEYEDNYLAIVNKPAGIVVSGNKRWTLENALPNNIKQSTQPDGLKFPEPAHRLDLPTSGVILVGKTANVLVSLNKLFEEKKITKVYHAVVIGKTKTEGIIEGKIDEKEAITYFKVLKTLSSPRFEFLNLVELKPKTGRKHQLRIHMSQLGNPILGDSAYGRDGLILKGKGLYLHASKLLFKHPVSKKEIEVEIDLPKKFKSIFS